MASAWGLSWLTAWGNSWGATDVQETPSKGGISDREIRRYRQYLERLAKVTELKNITPKIQEIAEEIVEEIPIEAPQIKRIANEQTINFSALLGEIELLRKYIDERIQYQSFLREQEDELALLLMI